MTTLLLPKVLALSVLCLGLAALAGCTYSYSDMRADRPIHEEEFSIPAPRLATCTENALALHYGGGERGMLYNTYSVSHLTDGNVIHVNGRIESQFMWDLSFVPTSASTTRVELRSSKNILGDVNYPSDIWQTIERACG